MDPQQQEIQPSALQEKPQKNYWKIGLLSFLGVLLAGGILFAGYTLGQQKNAPSSATTVPTTSVPSPTQTTTNNATANWKTYSNSDFSFRYPSRMSIQNETPATVRWKSEYIRGVQDYSFNDLVLRSQKNPFPKLTVGSSIKRYSPIEEDGIINGEIVYIRTDEQINIDEKIAQSYIYSCGPDCDYQTVYFQSNNTYYELTNDIAGGGAQAKFNQILSTFKFTQ